MTYSNPDAKYFKNCLHCGKHLPVPSWKYCDDPDCIKERQELCLRNIKARSPDPPPIKREHYANLITLVADSNVDGVVGLIKTIEKEARREERTKIAQQITRNQWTSQP